MIYTVTCNPAVDYVVHTDKIDLTGVNRSKYDKIYFGGKGINVSLVLNQLGIKSVAMGFVAGFTGEAIEKGIQQKGIETDFVHLKNGYSRINVKIKSDSELEVNGQGPEIDSCALNDLFAKLDRLKEGDTLVLGGSVPASLPGDTYEQILEKISGRNVRAIVDASGNLLMNVLKYKPFLVKPNNFELGDLFGVKLNTCEETVVYGEKLQKLGARNVLVSLAENGAVLLDEEGKIHSCGVCRGELKNSVGAGDSMVAGFIAGLMEGDYDYALKLGTAAGGATAFSEDLGQRDEIFRLLKQL